MKKVLVLLAVAALAATSCSDAGKKTEAEVKNTVETTEETTKEVVAEVKEEVTEAVSTGVKYAEGTVGNSIMTFINSENAGTQSFTLDALAAGEGKGELSPEAKLQLSSIADILAANPELKAEIQAHGPDKLGIKPKTVVKAGWVKTKLVLFKDFKAGQLTSKGYGSEKLLPGIDAKADAQKRVVIALTK